MHLFLVAIMVMFLASPAFCQTPDWVKEFRAIVDNVYEESGQKSLALLHSTRRGNCVAFAKLGAEIAMRNGLVCESLSLGSRSSVARHRIALIHDYDGRLWVVSNDDIHRVSSEEEAIEDAISYIDTSWAFRPMPWEPNYWTYRQEDRCTEYYNWELKNKHTFTKEELK